MTYRITSEHAVSLLKVMEIDPSVDFHRLRWSQYDQLVEVAKRVGYRKPRNASGSTARYFHAYLCRRAAKVAA